jgi:hypothetical protein
MNDRKLTMTRALSKSRRDFAPRTGGADQA